MGLSNEFERHYIGRSSLFQNSGGGKERGAIAPLHPSGWVGRKNREGDEVIIDKYQRMAGIALAS